MLTASASSSYFFLSTGPRFFEGEEGSAEESQASQAHDNEEQMEEEERIVDAFTRDLSKSDEHDHTLVTSVVGREEEERRVMSVLCRKTKSNPLLLGDAGEKYVRT